MSAEEILYESYNKGIRDKVITEYGKIKHSYLYDINGGYTQAYMNVINKIKEKWKNF